MSNGRLERIKEELTYLANTKDQIVVLSKNDYEYIIEQAELAEKLRLFKTHTESLASVVSELEQENERLKEIIKTAIYIRMYAEGDSEEHAEKMFEELSKAGS